MLEFILEFLFPTVCGFCGKLDKNGICPKCYFNIKEKINDNIILFREKNFGKLIYLFKYEGIIRDRILDYKFNDKSYLYKTFSKFILKNKKICGNLKKYDIIIPVPMHKEKLKKRGYNQTELIAKELAKKLEILYDKESLKKVKNTDTQSLLNQTQRAKNVIGAYEIKSNNRVNKKNILLIDDIYTTGSTVNECSRVLKQAGAKNIDVLVIAKD